MQVAYPYGFDALGRTATTGEDAHVRDLIEAVLFTTPGERVNHPTFGTGLLALVFAPVDQSLGGSLRSAIAAALTQWLGDVISVKRIDAVVEDSTVRVTVDYVIQRSDTAASATFVRDVP